MNNDILKEGVPEHGIQFNKILKDYFKSGEPFSCIRLGNTENYILNVLYNNEEITSQYHYESLHNVAGVFPKSLEFYKKEFLNENVKSIKNSDIVGWVAITQPLPNSKFYNDLLKEKVCFTEIRVLDPCFLYVEYDEPWTMELAGKKVLVVNSMEKTILKQWENKEKIWGNKTNKMLPFDLVGVIKSPHPPHIEGGDLIVDSKKITTWIDTKNFLESQIDMYEYDVLLCGCGAMAPALASYAKSKGKIGITMCSGTQLLFGISGKRWSLNKGFTHFHQSVNDYWRYPDPDDIPMNSRIVEGAEGMCYWG